MGMLELCSFWWRNVFYHTPLLMSLTLWDGGCFLMRRPHKDLIMQRGEWRSVCGVFINWILNTCQGWIVASDAVTDQSYVVRSLRQDTAYMFLVRAQNSHGLSLPSHVTAPIRTKGGWSFVCFSETHISICSYIHLVGVKPMLGVTMLVKVWPPSWIVPMGV